MHFTTDQHTPYGNTYPHTPQADPLQLVLRSQAKLERRIRDRIVFAQPHLTLNGSGLVFPNSIVIIQGKTGVHKSRLVESIVSCLLASDEAGDGNFLGFRRVSGAKRFRVVYVDTERNENDQLPYAIQQINRMSGHEVREMVPGLASFSLIDVPREQRHLALQLYLQGVAVDDAGLHTVVVLDVITDCVANFNDPRDSMGLTDFLNQQISQRSVTFICVIHENPGVGDKARGHVGTELMNKASTILQIGFQKDGQGRDTDLLVINNLKNRAGAKVPSVFARYDAARQALVVADEEQVRQHADGRRTKLSTAELMAFLASDLTVPTPCGEVVEMVRSYFACSKNTVLERIKDLVYEGNRQQIAADLRGPVLNQEQQGNMMLYSVKFPLADEA